MFCSLSSFSGLSDRSGHTAWYQILPVRCLPGQLLRQGVIVNLWSKISIFLRFEKSQLSVFEMFPVFSIQRFKKVIEGAGKQREVWKVFFPQALGFDPTPATFNKIEEGRIGWKVMAPQVEGFCHFHNQAASLLTGVVYHQRDRFSGIRGTESLQKFADHLRIDRTGCTNIHKTMVAGLNGTKKSVTLPPASTRCQAPGEGPIHAQKVTNNENLEIWLPRHRRCSALGQSAGAERSDREIALSSIGDAAGTLS